MRYETKPEQIRQIITEIVKLLEEHSQVGDKPITVRFIGFGTYSLEINVLAFVMTTDYLEFLEITEQINIESWKLLRQQAPS